MNWRDLIAVHPGADLFPMMSDSEIDELAKDIAANTNTLRLPLSIWRSLPGATWQLLDGRNRVAALARLPDGDELIRGAIGCANQYEAHVDPWAFVISANIRRRHLNPTERESLLIEVIAHNPTKSDRQIGKEVGVDGKTVAAARRKGEDVRSIPHVSQRTDSAGRQQPAHKPAHRQPPAALVNNTVPRHVEPESVVGQFRVASPSAAPRPAPSVVGAFNASGPTHPSAASLTPSPDFEARASKFLEAVAERRAAFRSGTLSQRCRLAARFISEIDVTVEELERFVNSPDDGDTAVTGDAVLQ